MMDNIGTSGDLGIIPVEYRGYRVLPEGDGKGVYFHKRDGGWVKIGHYFSINKAKEFIDTRLANEVDTHYKGHELLKYEHSIEIVKDTVLIAVVQVKVITYPEGSAYAHCLRLIDDWVEKDKEPEYLDNL
jgi:hypothetical protein